MFKREKRIERNVCKKVLTQLQVPNIPLKLLLGAHTGWPDRQFLLGGGKVLFIEFKDPDGEVAPIQVYMIDLLRGMGYEVQVHDNEDEAIQAIRSAKVVAAWLPKESEEIPARPRRSHGVARPRPR